MLRVRQAGSLAGVDIIPSFAARRCDRGIFKGLQVGLEL